MHHNVPSYASIYCIYSTEACMKLLLSSSTRPTLHAPYNDSRIEKSVKV